MKFKYIAIKCIKEQFVENLISCIQTNHSNLLNLLNDFRNRLLTETEFLKLQQIFRINETLKIQNSGLWKNVPWKDELLDYYDFSGKRMGAAPRDFQHFMGLPHGSSITFIKSSFTNKFLVVQRADTDELEMLIGGHKPFNISFVNNLIKEVQEELFKGKLIKLAKYFSKPKLVIPPSINGEDALGCNIHFSHPYIMEFNEKIPFNLDPKEVRHYSWKSKDEIAKLISSDQKKYKLLENGFQTLNTIKNLKN